MDKKIAILLAAAAVVGVLLVGAYMLYSGSAPGGQGANIPIRPGVLGTLKTSTSASVTIALQDGSERTFAVSEGTHIITRVSGGEIGKTLAQMESGATLLVMPGAADSSSAASVSHIPVLSVPAPSPAGPPVSTTGKVVNMTASAIIIETQSGGIVSVVVPESALVYSNVLAEQKGKTYSDITLGTQVVVSGVASVNGLIADSIQLLVLLVP